jgi:hypothetical protein
MATSPNYRVARFQKREPAQARADQSPMVDLRSKLIHARFTIFRFR